jgi:hypothetical protein
MMTKTEIKIQKSPAMFTVNEELINFKNSTVNRSVEKITSWRDSSLKIVAKRRSRSGVTINSNFFQFLFFLTISISV